MLGYAATSAETPQLPSNLDTTYLGGLSNFLSTSTSSPLKLHPFPSGYQAIAGDPTACLNVDPENWTANATMGDGVRVDSGRGRPRRVGEPPDPDGRRRGDDSRQRQPPLPHGGAAGHGVGRRSRMRHREDVHLQHALLEERDSVDLALPYGTWKIYTGNTPGSTTQHLTSGIEVHDGVITFDSSGNLVRGVLGNGGFSGGIVRLDPRPPL